MDAPPRTALRYAHIASKSWSESKRASDTPSAYPSAQRKRTPPKAIGDWTGPVSSTAILR